MFAKDQCNGAKQLKCTRLFYTKFGATKTYMLTHISVEKMRKQLCLSNCEESPKVLTTHKQ